MEETETEVVTCFLRDPRSGDVLLLRRPDEAPTYGGCWGAVSGYIECDDTDEDAYREIREETGAEATLVRRGEPFVVEDGALGERFVVYPYLFDTLGQGVTLNYESDLAEWCSPTEILRRNTVPDLRKSYTSVAPTVETVAGDDEHGSAYISARALEVLRDTAAVGGPEGTKRVAREIVEARPSMAVVANRVARAYDEGVSEGTGTEGVERAAHEAIGRAHTVDGRAAEQVAEKLSGSVVTLSRSGTVVEALERSEVEEVVVAESLPSGEGIAFADEVEERTEACVSVVPDSCVFGAVRDADTAVVGADTVLADGSVVNKVGSASLALAAGHYRVPLYAVASKDKIAPPGFDFGSETVVYRDEEVPVFEAVPSEHVTLVTEEGVMSDDRVEEVSRKHEHISDQLR